MFLAVRISSCECTWVVWKTLKKITLLSDMSQEFVIFPRVISPDFTRASIINK